MGGENLLLRDRRKGFGHVFLHAIFGNLHGALKLWIPARGAEAFLRNITQNHFYTLNCHVSLRPYFVRGLGTLVRVTLCVGSSFGKTRCFLIPRTLHSLHFMHVGSLSLQTNPHFFEVFIAPYLPRGDLPRGVSRFEQTCASTPLRLR